MMTWLAARFGVTGARWLIGGLIVAFVIGAAFLLGRCTRSDPDKEAQIEQTSRSSEAVSNAANAAIGTLENRVATEDAIDQSVEEATKGINDAKTAADVRATVVRSVCGSPAHYNDPACRVQ